jgi:hypothetical protein
MALPSSNPIKAKRKSEKRQKTIWIPSSKKGVLELVSRTERKSNQSNPKTAGRESKTSYLMASEAKIV